MVVRTDDGKALTVTVTAPSGPRRGVVVLGHAMWVGGRTLRKVAASLATRGYEAWSVDFRGHGDSGPPAGRTVDWSYDDIARHDIPSVVRAAAEHAQGPVFVLGHSLGGHATMAGLAADPSLPVRAVAAFGANVWLERMEPHAALWALKRATLRGWRTLTALAGRFPVKELRLGTDDEARSYVFQLVDSALSDRWTSRGGDVDYLAGMTKVEVPVLAVSSVGDRWMCTPDSTRRFFAFAGGPVVHRVVGEGAGEPRDVSHMGLVLDPRMAPVFEEVGQWFDSFA